MPMQATYPHGPAGRHWLKRLWIGRTAAIVIAIIAAVGVMAGESWVIENAPPTQLACDIGQASDLTRALDSGFSAMAAISEPSSGVERTDGRLADDLGALRVRASSSR